MPPPPATVLPAGPGRVARPGRQRAAGPAARARRRRATAAGGPPSTAPPSPRAGTTAGRRPSTSRPTAASWTSPTTPGCGLPLLWVQLGLLVLVVVLALPQVRASLDDADGNADVGADLPEHRDGRRRGSRRRAVTGRRRRAGWRAGRACRCSWLPCCWPASGSPPTSPRRRQPTAATVPAAADARPAVEVARADAACPDPAVDDRTADPGAAWRPRARPATTPGEEPVRPAGPGWPGSPAYRCPRPTSTAPGTGSVLATAGQGPLVARGDRRGRPRGWPPGC